MPCRWDGWGEINISPCLMSFFYLVCCQRSYREYLSLEFFQSLKLGKKERKRISFITLWLQIWLTIFPCFWHRIREKKNPPMSKKERIFFSWINPLVAEACCWSSPLLFVTEVYKKWLNHIRWHLPLCDGTNRKKNLSVPLDWRKENFT